MLNLRFEDDTLFSTLPLFSKQYENLMKKHDLGYCIKKNFFSFQEVGIRKCFSLKNQTVNILIFKIQRERERKGE